MALLGQLWAESRPRLLAMLRRRIDPGLAARIDPEGVLNEASLDAARDWGRFQARPGLSAYAWLYRVALDRLSTAVNPPKNDGPECPGAA
jgi:hypothetical protein